MALLFYSLRLNIRYKNINPKHSGTIPNNNLDMAKIFRCPSNYSVYKGKADLGVVIKQAGYKAHYRAGRTSGSADEIHRYQLMSQSSVVFERQPAAIESISQLR